MMYRFTPRLLPRPNMNFYLAWKKTSLQKWVSAIYYYCVQKKYKIIKSLKPPGEVLQKLFPNNPTRACLLCCSALCCTTVQVPNQRSLLVWAQKMTAVPCLMPPCFSLAHLGHLDVTAGTHAPESRWWRESQHFSAAELFQPRILKLHMLKHGHVCLEVLPGVPFVVCTLFFLQLEVDKILI